MTLERNTKAPDKKLLSALRLDRILLLLAVFLLGGLLSSFGFAPFPALTRGAIDTIRLLNEITLTRPEILEPSPYDGSGATIYNPTAVQPGLTLIQGLLPGGAQVRLVDMTGVEIHRWTVDFFRIWNDPEHIVPAANIPKSKHNYHTQGFWPLTDGSIVVNIGDMGTVLLDRCSHPIWRVDRMTHHSVTPTPDGKFWLPSHISVFETPKALLPANLDAAQIAWLLEGTLKNYNNSIILINDDGVVEKEFSVLQAIHDAGLEHALYASLQEIPADPTHVNDIELVNEALADKIEDVNPGDLLVSIREMHMLAILDQFDGRLKWYRQGTWVRQHDPDVMPDGTIEIYNNRSNTINSPVNGSQIVSYDPLSDTITVLHPIGEDDAFYSPIMGTHQRLANDNLLITEAVAGRAFEVTRAGEIVWDYRLPYDDEVASLFEAAMRVPINYFEVKTWTCQEK